jgi:hypothetical protein
MVAFLLTGRAVAVARGSVVAGAVPGDFGGGKAIEGAARKDGGGGPGSVVTSDEPAWYAIVGD